MSDPSTLSMSPNQATLAEKSIRFSSLAAAQPLNILSRPETLKASGSRRACRRPSAAMPVLSLISPISPKQLGMVSPELRRRDCPRPLRRQRHDLDSRQETGPSFPRLRALSRLCQRHRSSPRVREGGPVPRRRRRTIGRGEGTSTIQQSSALTFDARRFFRHYSAGFAPRFLLDV